MAVALCSYCLIRYYNYIVTSRKKRRYGCSDPPKFPHRDPLGYDVFQARKRAVKEGRSAAYDRSLFELYGKTFETVMWGTARQRMISTMDPSNIQAIASLAFGNFEFQSFRESLGPFMGKGVLTTDGPYWVHSRALIRPTFARSRIGNFASFEVHVKRFLELLPRDGSTVDLQPLFKRLFLDASTEFFLGESVDSQLPGTNFDGDQFLQAFEDALRGMGRTSELGVLGRFVQLDPKLAMAHNTVYTFIDKYVDRAILKTSNKQRAQDSKDGDDYVLIEEMAKNCKDKTQLRHEILNVFLPARDTTGLAVGYLIYNLARHPEVTAKLRAEILAAVPSRTMITFDLLKSIRYLQYVLNESLRIRSPIHFSQRTCSEDCVLPTGGGPKGKAPILVTKGQSLTINVNALHYDKDIWGKDAHQFRPERWETERPLWEYLPFLGGPRICPAQQMVLAECSYIIVRILQEFQNIENRDPQPWAEEIRMQAESRHGIKIGLIPL